VSSVINPLLYVLVCAVIIPTDTRENMMGQEQDKDRNFVSFTRDWHTINSKVAESEITP
jgi:hypothetical protein